MKAMVYEDRLDSFAEFALRFVKWSFVDNAKTVKSKELAAKIQEYFLIMPTQYASGLELASKTIVSDLPNNPDDEKVSYRKAFDTVIYFINIS